MITVALSFILMQVILYLARHFQERSFLETATVLVGPVTARIVAVLLFVFILGALISSLRMGIGLFAFVYAQTPLTVLLLTGLAVVIYALYAGLEVIARVGQLLMPQVILILLIGILLAAPNMRTENLFPLMEDGLRPVLASGIMQFGQWGEIITLVVLLPYVHNREALPRHLNRSLGGGSLLMLAIAGAVIAVLGPFAPGVSFKLFEVYRSISIARFIERIDIFLILMYYFVVFVKVCVLSYALLLLFCQFFNLRTYHPFILPMGAIGAALASITPITIPRLLGHPIFMLPFNLFIELVVPTVLLVGSILKRRRLARHKAFS